MFTPRVRTSAPLRALGKGPVAPSPSANTAPGARPVRFALTVPLCALFALGSLGGCCTRPRAEGLQAPGTAALPQPQGDVTNAGPEAGVAAPTTPTPQPLVANQGILGAPPGAVPMSLAPIVRRVRGSVVSIFTAQVEMVMPQWGFADPSERVRRGAGTGFIIENNEILTNNHVVEHAQHIEVQLDNGHRYPAQIVGRDPRTDVALLRLTGATGAQTQPITLGDSDVAEVGDWVVAMGTPYGLSQTVTTGIISAKGRTGRDVPLDPAGYYSFIQTDASINPGNSGGPLLNLRGEVVGINTAINREAQGIGFAIPINMVRTILPSLRQHGRVIRSYLGISINDVDESVAQAQHLPDTDGALVMDIDPQGPAALGGMQPGDVIRTFDGTVIHNAGELSWQASNAGIGHQATVLVRRAGQELTLSLVLIAMREPTR
ncbi:MAG: trypsin-like peptidase domain-containing protein [Deltaproteobacteria bacterium]|nr:trypsin-like peptidase domain-containing protein [Deltaproteobacteria bacterium]